MKSIKRGSPLFYTLIVLTILIVSGLGIWQFYKYKLVKSGLNDTVREKTKGLYQVTYDSLFLDEVLGTLHVSNVKLLPDTGVYRQMINEKKNPPVLITINIPKLEITRVKTPKAILDKQIEGGRIEINRAMIEVGMSDFLKDSTPYSPGKEIYQQILGTLKSIKMDTIEVNHSTLVVKDLSTGKVRFTGEDFSIVLTDLLIDSISKDDSSRILFSRNLALACRQIRIPSKDKKYQFDFEGLRFTSETDRFSINRIAVIPQLSETAFASSYKYSKDRYDFLLESISLSRINREALWHKRIEADSLTVEKSSFKIFRDISHPHDSLDRVGTFPQQQLMRLSIPVALKKLVLKSSFIEYKEKNAKSDSSGKVQFAAVHAVISNITNMKSHIARNNICLLDFRSRFLDKATFNAQLKMILKDPNGKFEISGNLGSMPAETINRLSEPMGLAKMDKGTVDGMKFHLYGDNLKCSGNLLFLYHGIHLTLLKKDEEQNVYKKKGLATFAANLVIKNDNPSNGKVRTSNPKYDRDRYRSIFNVMWKTAFKGIKETAGMK